MRVLYFHQHFSTPKGAAGIRSYAMAQTLIANGHEVIMVCGSFAVGQTGLSGPFVRGARRGHVNGIDVIEFEVPYSNRLSFIRRVEAFLCFAWRSIKVAMKEEYDLVFATTTPLTAGIPGIAARWLRRKPFVFEVRDLWPELPRAMGVIKNPVILTLMSVLEWCTCRSAHRLVALSPGIAGGIQRLGIPESRVTVIPNGCDFDIFSKPETPWRPSGVEPTDLMAIFAGTHGVANGLTAVLEAAAVLKSRSRSDIKLVLIGDGAIKSVLRKDASARGLDNVVFCEPVNKAKLAGLMAATDLGLQILANVEAFYFGTSPNKFFDYIAAGLPVLNNYPGWLAGMIERNGCGFAVPPDDPKAFADALERAADNPDELEKMGQSARALAWKEFNRMTLAENFVDTLESALKDA